MADRIFKHLPLNKIRFLKMLKIREIYFIKSAKYLFLFYNVLFIKRICSQVKKKMGAKRSKV